MGKKTGKNQTNSRTIITNGALKIIFLITTVIGVSVLTYLLLRLFKVIYRSDSGDFEFNAELFKGFKNAWFGLFAIILIQSALSVLLCAIPGISMAFIVIIKMLYPKGVFAFLISYAAVMISSGATYALGRFGGFSFCEKALGKNECDKAADILRRKSTVYFPLMMALPAFPDDALIMLAGTFKMSLKWFIPSVMIGRGIGVAAIVFGIDLIPFKNFKGIYDWLLFITFCAFWICVLFYLAHKLNQKIESRAASQKRQINDDFV